MKKYLVYLFLVCFILIINFNEIWAAPKFVGESKFYHDDNGVYREIKCVYNYSFSVDSSGKVKTDRSGAPESYTLNRSMEVSNEKKNLEFIIRDYSGGSSVKTQTYVAATAEVEPIVIGAIGGIIGSQIISDWLDENDYFAKYLACPSAILQESSGKLLLSKAKGVPTTWNVFGIGKAGSIVYTLKNSSKEGNKYITTVSNCKVKNIKDDTDEVTFSTEWASNGSPALEFKVNYFHGNEDASSSTGLLKNSLIQNVIGNPALQERLFSGQCPEDIEFDPEKKQLLFPSYDPNVNRISGDFIEEDFDCNSFGSLLEWLQGIFTTVKISAPVLVIILGIVDFFTAIAASSDDAMKKMWTKFVKRLVIGAAVLIIPYIIELILNIAGYGDTICGIH